MNIIITSCEELKLLRRSITVLATPGTIEKMFYNEFDCLTLTTLGGRIDCSEPFRIEYSEPVPEDDEMIEMSIDSLRVGLMNPKSTQHGTPYVVLLKEKTAERYLPIFIGPAEANAIALKLRGEHVPRPLTHDLLNSVVDALGASIDSIVVSDLKNDTFYAKIILNVNSGQMEIDSRPSDAFALALAAPNQVPIFAEESVLDKAGIALSRDEGDELVMEGEQANIESSGKSPESKPRKVSEEELGKLSAYKEFLEGLDLEDFGKYKS